MQQTNLTGGTTSKKVKVDNYNGFLAVGIKWINGDKKKVAVYCQGLVYCKFFDGTGAKNAGGHHPGCTTMLYAEVLPDSIV